MTISSRITRLKIRYIEVSYIYSRQDIKGTRMYLPLFLSMLEVLQETHYGDRTFRCALLLYVHNMCTLYGSI
jgi:hypothetical protein